MEFIIEHGIELFAGLAGVFGGAKLVPYIKLIRDLAKAWFTYQEIAEDKKFTDKEKIRFADVVIEIIDKSKAIKNPNKEQKK